MEQKQWSGIEFRPHETKSISKVIFEEIKFFTDEETLFFLKSSYFVSTMCDKPLMSAITIRNILACIYKHLSSHVYCLLMQIQDFHRFPCIAFCNYFLLNLEEEKQFHRTKKMWHIQYANLVCKGCSEYDMRRTCCCVINEKRSNFCSWAEF